MCRLSRARLILITLFRAGGSFEFLERICCQIKFQALMKHQKTSCYFYEVFIRLTVIYFSIFLSVPIYESSISACTTSILFNDLIGQNVI